MTVRGKDADKFWFSLFHEIGHIVLDHINKNGTNDMRESDADNFAKNILIPNDDFYKFVKNKDFKEVTLKKFAKAEGMAVLNSSW